MSKHLINLSRAAEQYDISVKTLRRRIADGSLPAYRVGPRLRPENPRFPAPLIDRPGATLWARAAIEAFDESWTPKPGRPATPRIEVYREAVGEPVDLTGVDPAASTTTTGQAASDELKGARRT